MATAGYSGTPLLQKLGIKPSMKLLLVNSPRNYHELLQSDVSSQLIKGKTAPDFIHLFVTSITEFEKEMRKIKPAYQKNTSLIIWVSWYKKAAKIPTDVTEDVIRNYALTNGLVDVKVCAVSEEWSGLKLVVPLSLRI